MQSLNFIIPFTEFNKLDFISVFSSIYIYLEKITADSDYECSVKNGGKCTGCGNCRKSIHGIMEQHYFLFDTVTGRSSLRCHYDNSRTEMQLLVGETGEDDCGTAETVDFLFGFTGYDYDVITDSSKFTDAIVSSIEADRPVIAKVPGDNGRYRVIIGYDGESLIEPDYKGAQALPTEPVKLSDIIALYRIGEKKDRRFTLRDGLERIAMVMEYNDQNDLWDEYASRIGWHGGMASVPVEEQYARMKRIYMTMWHTFNCHNFAEVFRRRITDELKNPILDEMCKKIDYSYNYTHDLAWSLIGLKDLIKWDEQWDGIRVGYAEMIKLVIIQLRENDRNVLRMVRDALAKLK